MNSLLKKTLKWSSITTLSLVVLYYGSIYGYYFYLDSLPKEEKYLIPEGYVGWIVINYIVLNTQEIPVDETGLKIIKIPLNGEFKTSHNPTTSNDSEGRYGAEYYYYSKEGEKVIPLELIDWRGNQGRVDENGKYYEFRTRLWVGTQEQYAKYGMASYSNPKPGPLFQLKNQ